MPFLLLMGARWSTDVPRSRLKWGWSAAKLAGTRSVRFLREGLLLLPVPSRLVTILIASAVLKPATILIATPRTELTLWALTAAMDGRP